MPGGGVQLPKMVGGPTSTKLAEEDLQRLVYDSGLHDAFKEICVEILAERPDDVFSFCAERLRQIANAEQAAEAQSKRLRKKRAQEARAMNKKLGGRGSPKRKL